MKPMINSLPETVFTTKVDDLLNWGRASSQWYMLFRVSVLRDRADADGRTTRRSRSVRGGSTRNTAAVGSNDCSRNSDLQDGQTDEAASRSDAGSKIRHLNGQLFKLRRVISVSLFGMQGGRQDRAGGCLCAGMSATSGSVDRRSSTHSGQDDTREVAGKVQPPELRIS